MESMVLEAMRVGPLQTNCYLAGDAHELLVIDPGAQPERILRTIREKGYLAKHVILTHAHYDHIGGVSAVLEGTGATLCLGAEELDVYHDSRANVSADFVSGFCPPDPTLLLREGDVVQSGPFGFRVLHTPGHTKGGICLLCGDVLLSGDTLFYGSIGRADLPTGNLGQELRSIRDKLFCLDDHTKVYPGHGPSTTIGFEKRHSEYFEYERYADE